MTQLSTSITPVLAGGTMAPPTVARQSTPDKSPNIVCRIDFTTNYHRFKEPPVHRHTRHA